MRWQPAVRTVPAYHDHPAYIEALAKSIERHFADEPVLAGPPSTSYRVHKFVKRNRIGVLAASLVLAALVLAAGKPLLLEKPMTGTLPEAQRLVELDRASDTPLMLAQALRARRSSSSSACTAFGLVPEGKNRPKAT